mmetsp:Transcript_8002/g.22066  ORF Transcript_8002/g.22066 Transcript_8002/m.22066 type:complete len:224 (+) Transcript_8002:883-1554(+)
MLGSLLDQMLTLHLGHETRNLYDQRLKASRQEVQRKCVGTPSDPPREINVHTRPHEGSSLEHENCAGEIRHTVNWNWHFVFFHPEEGEETVPHATFQPPESVVPLGVCQMYVLQHLFELQQGGRPRPVIVYRGVHAIPMSGERQDIRHRTRSLLVLTVAIIKAKRMVPRDHVGADPQRLIEAPSVASCYTNQQPRDSQHYRTPARPGTAPHNLIPISVLNPTA